MKHLVFCAVRPIVWYQYTNVSKKCSSLIFHPELKPNYLSESSVKKVKWSRYRPGVAQRVGRGTALLFHDCGTRRGVSGQQHARAAIYPRQRPGTHCTGGWVGPRVGLDGRKISSPPGFDPRTVQPAVSRYNDWATRPTHNSLHCVKIPTGMTTNFLICIRY
jgi:hypothetical protein